MDWSPDRKSLRLPALTTAHSHAFQRGMRGAAQRRYDASKDDFWSWRGQMYRVARMLDPETMEAIARVAYRELKSSGVHTVGEFHYVHHQADGSPYNERTLLSDVLIRAARSEGLRICLIRAAYNRAGPGRTAEEYQLRFCDSTVDDVLRDVDTLRSKYAGDPMVRVGVAAHSVRAVPPGWLKPLAEYADMYELPFHMHVAEQVREVDECVWETTKRPVELLAENGVLSQRFVAIHGTQLMAHEARMLGEANATVCICATTERDLGDGLPDITAMRKSRVRLCTGTDSHVSSDVIDDLRSLETHERLRTRERVTFGESGQSPAEQLWREGSVNGALACGFQDAGAAVEIDVEHPTLALVNEDHLLDAIVFSGHQGLVKRVVASCATTESL